MTSLTIEKGIPIPEDNFRQKNAIKGGHYTPFPWDDMEVGDSVVVPDAKTGEVARQWAKRRGRKFTAQKQADGSGWRVWRII